MAGWGSIIWKIVAARCSIASCQVRLVLGVLFLASARLITLPSAAAEDPWRFAVK